jgi:cation diffusion facilitator family transporter
MRPRAAFDLPDELETVMDRARRLEWWSIGSMCAVALAVYLAMGSSQAMRAALVEDLLSLVPPFAFLVSARYRHRAPDSRFPYGYHRSTTIAFLAGAVALTLFGGIMLFESAAGLLRREHPTIGTSIVLGHVVWGGWIMVAVLLLSGVPPLVLGRLKLEPARKLHDKTLMADADMNRADWLTAVAGATGVMGIGLGWWWADGVAGGVISLSIVMDGLSNLRHVVADLMDRRPRTVDGDDSDAPGKVQEAIGALPWVESAELRLREEGHVFVGEAFVTTLRTDRLSAKIEEVRRAAAVVDWRVHDLVVQIEEARCEGWRADAPSARARVS